MHFESINHVRFKILSTPNRDRYAEQTELYLDAMLVAHRCGSQPQIICEDIDFYVLLTSNARFSTFFFHHRVCFFSRWPVGGDYESAVIRCATRKNKCVRNKFNIRK